MDRGGSLVGRGVSAAALPAHDLPVTRDDSAFAELYATELQSQVRRAALLTGDSELAHDLVHDAFVELYRRWHTLDQPGAYLAVAVLNRCRDHGRRQSVARRRLPLMADRHVPSTDHEFLLDALQQLPFNHRAALVLRYYHALTEAEIAVQLACRPGSVGPWISRGLKQLRKALT